MPELYYSPMYAFFGWLSQFSPETKYILIQFPDISKEQTNYVTLNSTAGLNCAVVGLVDYKTSATPIRKGAVYPFIIWHSTISL